MFEHTFRLVLFRTFTDVECHGFGIKDMLRLKWQLELHMIIILAIYANWAKP